MSMWHVLPRHYSFLHDIDLTKQSNLETFSHFCPEAAAHLYGIASFNLNGYVREAALKYLQNLPPSEILPYILLRLNDWVPQVRDKARKIFLKIFPLISVNDLLKYYCLIHWLSITERMPLLDIQILIFNKILHPQRRKEMFLALEKLPLKGYLFWWNLLFKETDERHNSFIDKASLLCHRLLFRKLKTSYDNLIEKAIEDKLSEVRVCAAYHLPHDQNLAQRIQILISDKAPRVRYAALKKIPLEKAALYKEFFEKALIDDSKSIREYARFVMHALGHDNIRAFYQKERFSHS